MSWGTTNPSVATVNSNGLVTAVGSGTCTIRCTSTDGSGVYAECSVTVESSQGVKNIRISDKGPVKFFLTNSVGIPTEIDKIIHIDDIKIEHILYLKE